MLAPFAASNKYMRRIPAILFAALILNACQKPIINFRIELLDMPAESAYLNLCGQTTPLKLNDNVFNLNYAFRCEGSGNITVNYKNRKKVICNVGYITNLSMNFNYQIKGGACNIDTHMTSAVPASAGSYSST